MLLDIIGTAVNSAMLRDLPDTNGKRPYYHELEVYSFPQQWGSTALGFGGIGGQAFTTAQTTVVIHNSYAAVYFGGQLAYVKPVTQELIKDMQSHHMAAVIGAGKYKG